MKIKALATIIALLIGLNSFSQIRQGDFRRLNIREKIHSGLYDLIWPGDSTGQWFYSNMADPVEQLDGVNLRTLRRGLNTFLDSVVVVDGDTIIIPKPDTLFNSFTGQWLYSGDAIFFPPADSFYNYFTGEWLVNGDGITMPNYIEVRDRASKAMKFFRGAENSLDSLYFYDFEDIYGTQTKNKVLIKSDSLNWNWKGNMILEPNFTALGWAAGSTGRDTITAGDEIQEGDSIFIPLYGVQLYENLVLIGHGAVANKDSQIVIGNESLKELWLHSAIVAPTYKYRQGANEDTLFVRHLVLNEADSGKWLQHFGDSLAWMNIEIPELRVDSIFSLTSDTIFMNILKVDSIFVNTSRIDTIYNYTIRTDSIFSFTKDTIVVNNVLLVQTSRIDTIVSKEIQVQRINVNTTNTDTIYSFVSRVDTIYSFNSDTLYFFGVQRFEHVRTDSIFSFTSHTDSIFSFTSDTIYINNVLRVEEVRTDSIFTFITRVDSIFSFTSDTIYINNIIKAPQVVTDTLYSYIMRVDTIFSNTADTIYFEKPIYSTSIHGQTFITDYITVDSIVSKTDTLFINTLVKVPYIRTDTIFSLVTKTDSIFVKGKPMYLEHLEDVENDLSASVDAANNMLIYKNGKFGAYPGDSIKVKGTPLGTMATKNFWTGTAAEYEADTPKDGILPKAANTVAFILNGYGLAGLLLLLSLFFGSLRVQAQAWAGVKVAGDDVSKVYSGGVLIWEKPVLGAEFVYAGGTTTNRVRKYNTSDLSYIGQSDDYGGNIWSIVESGGYLYVGGGTTQTVRKYNASDLSYIGETAIYGGEIRTIVESGGFLYVGGNTGKIAKYNASDLSYIGEGVNDGGAIDSMVESGGYLYVGVNGTFRIRKYNASDLSYIRQSVSYGGFIYSIVESGGYLYVGGSTTRTVRKYNASDLSYISESGSYEGTIFSIIESGGYLYAGGATTRCVRKYSASDLSYIGESANYGGSIYSIVESGGYLYVGGSTTRTVRKYNASDLSYISESDDYGGIIYSIAAK
jgi:hypothetical protein